MIKTISYTGIKMMEHENCALKALTAKTTKNRVKGAAKSAEAKRRIKFQAHELWLANGRQRSLNEAERIRQELAKQGINRSIKTIYDWICDW